MASLSCHQRHHSAHHLRLILMQISWNRGVQARRTQRLEQVLRLLLLKVFLFQVIHIPPLSISLCPISHPPLTYLESAPTNRMTTSR